MTGHGFNTSSTSFDFGWAPATKVSCSSSTECTMVNPSSVATTLQVTAKTAMGTSPLNKDDDFTYVLNVTKVSPNSGPLAGGITVTVTGQGLTDKLKFDFGSSPATSVVCASLTSCTMFVPAHSAGTVDLIVETSLGNSPTTSADHFTYQAPAITGVSPSVGPTVGGETVNITGVGFDDTMTVKFGGVAAKVDICTSDSSCSVESPAGIKGIDPRHGDACRRHQQPDFGGSVHVRRVPLGRQRLAV